MKFDLNSLNLKRIIKKEHTNEMKWNEYIVANGACDMCTYRSLSRCVYVGGGPRGWAVVVRAGAAGGGGGFSGFSSK